MLRYLEDWILYLAIFPNWSHPWQWLRHLWRLMLRCSWRKREHVTAHLRGHEQEVCGLAWSPSGDQLASGGNDNLLHVWSSSREQPLHRLTAHQAAVKAVAWCPFQSNLLASGGGTADRCIRFWNTITGAHLNAVDTNSQVDNCAENWILSSISALQGSEIRWVLGPCSPFWQDIWLARLWFEATSSAEEYNWSDDCARFLSLLLQFFQKAVLLLVYLLYSKLTIPVIIWTSWSWTVGCTTVQGGRQCTSGRGV